MKTPSLFASLSALLVIAALGVYFGGRPAAARPNSGLAGNQLVRPSRPSARPDDQSRLYAQQQADPTSTVQAAAIAQPAPASLTAAYPEITTQVSDWKQFNREAKTITVAPFKGLPLHFTRVRVKDEGKYVTWIGTDPEIPSSSLIAVATPSGSYDSIMILPGTDQFSFHTEANGQTAITETNPADETCGIGGVKPKHPTQEPMTAALFKAQYAVGAQVAMAVTGDTTTVGPAGIPKADGALLYQEFLRPNSDVPMPVGGSVTLNVFPVATTNATHRISRFQWFFNGGPIPGATNSAFTATALGDYAVNVFWDDNASSGLIAVKVVAKSPTAATQVDVLFLYDADMLAFAAAQSSNPVGFIDGLSKAFVESSNVLLTNSAISNFQWRYLGVVQAPAYTRPTSSTFTDGNGVVHNVSTLQSDLTAMSPSGAIGAFVSKTRFDFGADQIVLWRGDRFSDASGEAFSNKQAPISSDQSLAVILQGVSFKTVAHEMSHNFGCEHERSAPNNPGQNPNARDGDGFIAYATVFSIASPLGGFNTAGTIMASGSSVVIPFFSNPNITLHIDGNLGGDLNASGDWGTHPIGLPVGDPKASFNAKVLTDNASAMAALAEEITAPAITTQPVNTSANTGSSLSISVAATGGGLNFQWSKDGSPISGATASSFSKTASSSDAGNYSVVVSNRLGTVTSSTATVTVSAVTTPPPTGGGSGGSSGGGGGGGAPSEWFLAALVALTALRRYTIKRR